jgi:hypothetical protein
MGRLKKVLELLPLIWEAPDERWATIGPILAEHEPPRCIDQRRALHAVILRLRSSYQWNKLPTEYADAWFPKCRAILVRWDKQAERHLGLFGRACTPL